jgi:hypothetical protein
MLTQSHAAGEPDASKPNAAKQKGRSQSSVAGFIYGGMPGLRQAGDPAKRAAERAEWLARARRMVKPPITQP